MEDAKQQKWHRAVLISSQLAASNVMKLTFAVESWPGHKAGQHVDVRLTSSDGYMAQRSYSIANEPSGKNMVELGVELMPDGEVSPYLWRLKPGDAIELCGPIGGHFIWDVAEKGPLVLIAGGSGMVPLMSMLRHHAKHDLDRERKIVFVISLRTADRLLYADELREMERELRNLRVAITFTDIAPEGWTGYARRIDREIFDAEIGKLRGDMPQIFICGPTRFVESAAQLLIAMGINSHLIRTERFGG